MQTVQRSELLQRLQAIVPGLSAREIIEQSSCIVFKGGYAYTFNEDVFCRVRSGLDKETVGAVVAKPLVEALNKIGSAQIKVKFTQDKMVLLDGTGAVTRLMKETEIKLPVDSVDKPKKDGWRPLPPAFTEAVSIVSACASNDETQEVLGCVHIHPQWVEACDDVRMARYQLITGFDKPIMVRKTSVKHVTQMDMSEFQETQRWVHFRNGAGLTLSCLRFSEKYPHDQITALFDGFKGKRCKFPTGVNRAADLASLFSSEDPEDTQITVAMKPGLMTITGVGNSGDHTAPKKCKYAGPPLSFKIPPKMLIDIVSQHKECRISDRHLVAQSQSWKFLTALGTNPKGEPAEGDSAEPNGEDGDT